MRTQKQKSSHELSHPATRPVWSGKGFLGILIRQVCDGTCREKHVTEQYNECDTFVCQYYTLCHCSVGTKWLVSHLVPRLVSLYMHVLSSQDTQDRICLSIMSLWLISILIMRSMIKLAYSQARSMYWGTWNGMMYASSPHPKEDIDTKVITMLFHFMLGKDIKLDHLRWTCKLRVGVCSMYGLGLLN